MNSVNYTHSKHFANPAVATSAHGEFSGVLSREDCESAHGEISQWDGYAVTDLVTLTDIASAANVGTVLYKDESTRFGLGSFKALGGSYAVFQLAQAHQKAHGELTNYVIATATDGNHGRSVAWGAKRLGIECHIFIHAHVSQQRSDAMSELGAVVHRIDGNYDDSLVECEKMAEQHGWQIVSDTSWEGYETVPIQVMAGYSVMASEIVEQLNGDIPSHLFIPAGCGGLAGGMLAYLWQVWQEKLPSIVIVESELSDCVYQSLASNKLELIDIVDETVMAGLSCGEVSRIAWPMLQKGAAHVITIPDDGVVPMMRWLARPTDSRRAIEGGECSAASLIALMASVGDENLRTAVGLDSDSTVLVLGTEGATDPDFYEAALSEYSSVS